MPDMHLTARQAAEHAAKAGAGQLVLTHLVPWNPQERTLAEAREVSSFAGPISLAAPGRIIDLG
jgi:ribonuclease BN (tRNA processing enzyme)